MDFKISIHKVKQCIGEESKEIGCLMCTSEDELKINKDGYVLCDHHYKEVEDK
tara:strand:+ start:168 stop:326 length:159 start_codon:yes stop_codon:yes gene_type:complete